jgi:hypothetical protein
MESATQFPRRPLLRLSGKSLGGLWSESIGGATLQKQVLCAPFEQFVRSSVRKSRVSRQSLEEEFSETGIHLAA